MAASTPLAPMLRLEFVRLGRDLKCIVMYALIAGVPLLPTILRGNGMKLQTLMSLFLAVLVAWSWGGDLAAGSLAPIAFGAASPRRLLASRMLAFTPLIIVANVVTAVASRAGAFELLAAIVFSAHVLLLGFVLATLFRSGEVGWLPFFFALVGVLLPIMAEIRNAQTVSPLLKWLAVLLLPAFAESIEVTSPVVMLVVHLTACLTWMMLSMILVERPGAMR